MRKILSVLILMMLTLVLGACVTIDDGEKVAATNTSTEVEVEESEEGEKVNLDIEIYNHKGITVVINNITVGGLFGSTIDYTISNSTDKQLTISAREVSVGNQMDDMVSIYADLPSGKTQRSTGYFEEHSVLESGTKIEGVIHVINDNYETLATAPFEITLD